MNNFLIMRRIIDFATPYFNARPEHAAFTDRFLGGSAVR